MKKIMMFYGGYIPGKRYGGPVTSMFHFSEMFGNDYIIKIICKEHDFLSKEKYRGIKKGWNLVGKAEVLYLSDKDFCKKTFADIINEQKPDIIYSSSIFSAAMNIPLMQIAKKNGIPMLLAPRGELSADRIATKWWKKRPFLVLLRGSGLLKHIMFQATSLYEFEDIKKVLKIDEGKIYMVPNIPCSIENKKKLMKEKGKIKIVATSRIQQKNNQLYSIKIVNQLKSDVIFDIYGSKEDPEYWKRCEEEIAKAPSNIEYNYKGVLPLTEIEKVYLDYDCLFHPTHSENYGHVIVEAFCHDCPVLISKETTPWDNIESFGGGWACRLGDDYKFIEVLEDLAQMNSAQYEEIVMGTRRYASELKMDQIKEDYEKMILGVLESKER